MPENAPKEPKKMKCFVITPIGGAETPLRRHINGIIDAAIIPALQKFDINGHIPHRLDSSGSITKDIIVHLFDDELVIANLTELNANVMYEVAVRHSFRKKIIIIAEKGTVLPFDIKDQRVIFYENDAQGVIDLQKELEKKIESVLNEKDEDISNVVYDSLQGKANKDHVMENISKMGQTKEDVNFQTFMVNQMDIIQKDVKMLMKHIENIGTSNYKETVLSINLLDDSQDNKITNGELVNTFIGLLKELRIDLEVVDISRNASKMRLLLRGEHYQIERLYKYIPRIGAAMGEKYNVTIS